MVICYWLFVIGCSLLVVRYWLFVIGYSLLVIRCLLLVVCYSSLVTLLKPFELLPSVFSLRPFT